MIDGKTISLIVPCKNEAGIIAAFIKRVPKYVDEIIIVDNNSTDNTADVARKAGARVIRETRHVGGIGYGYAHQAGLMKATGDYIVAMDGDDTYPVKKIRAIVRYMVRHNLDMTSCNRLPLTNRRAISWVRQLGIHILNLEVFILYGYPIKDILTGMWVISKKVSQELRATSGEWNYSPEIKLAGITNPDIRFAEYHIPHFERKNAVSKQRIFQTGFNHAMYLIKHRLSLITRNMKHAGRLVRHRLAFAA